MRNLFYTPLFGLIMHVYLKSIPQSSGSISLVYSGDINKPFPIVVFLLPNSKNNKYDSTSVFKYQISEEQFLKISESVTFNQPPPKDSLLINSLDIVFAHNGNCKTLSLFYFKDVRHSFEKLIKAFNSNDIHYYEIISKINLIMSKLKYQLKRK